MRQTPEDVVAAAKARGYKRGAHQERDTQTKLERYGPNTVAMHSTVLDRYATWQWDKLCDEAIKSKAKVPDFDLTRNSVLRRSAPVPGLAETKDFFRFYIDSSAGKITKNGKASVESMVARAEDFFRAFTFVTGTETDKAQNSEIYYWMRNVLTKEGILEDVKKAKYNLGPVVLDRVIQAIWTDLSVPNERVRIQNHLLLMLYAASGGRIGALFVGGLPYKDIEIVQARRPTGDGYRYFWRFDQRFVKNNRNAENCKYGTPGQDHPVLRHNVAVLLLVLALADKALFGYDSLEDLWEREILDGDDVHVFRWKDEALHIPIIRGFSRDGTDLKKPLTVGVFRKDFRSSLQLADYVDVAPSVHQIRRFLGQQVDKRYTEVERSQHINQSDTRIFGASYVADCSSVDGLSAFLGQTADHTPNDYFQGLEKFRERGAPTVLPARIERDLSKSKEVLLLKQQISAATDEDVRMELSSSLRSVLRQLKAKALTKHRQDWVRERRDWKILTRGKVAPICPDKNGNHLTAFIPELDRTAKIMVSGKECTREAIRDLYALASQDFTILYYPGEKPIQGQCRFCSTDMSNIWARDADVIRHIKNEELGNTYPAFCPLCNEFLQDEESTDCHLIDAHHIRINPQGIRKRKLQVGPSGDILTNPSVGAECLRDHHAEEGDEPKQVGLLSDCMLSAGDAVSWSPALSGETQVEPDTFPMEIGAATPLDDFMESCVEFPPSPEISPIWTDGTSENEGTMAEITTPTPALGSSTIGNINIDPQLWDKDMRPRKVRIILRSNGSDIKASTTSACTPISEKISDSTECSNLTHKAQDEFSASLYSHSQEDSEHRLFPANFTKEASPTMLEPCGPGASSDGPQEEETFAVDCILGRWRKKLFFLRWLDGTYGWEPRENILDDNLIKNFEECYDGFKSEVDVLGTRRRNGKTEYRLHWTGRPANEDAWVGENEMSPSLVSSHKPVGKQRRMKRKVR
ncbi:hypothetical protein CI238_13164 [Colletotrichum incanum]|uniref:Chromo domain-containing protein n=1 Tax=Colletotrichum incanum TaxID=1573173 RepID=A0A167BDY0_COLIC|nr:hypothetical protein CI238_13164 [Colletotrichum incanum]